MIVIKPEFSQYTLETYSNIKSKEDPSSWSRAVSCGQIDKQTDRQT